MVRTCQTILGPFCYISKKNTSDSKGQLAVYILSWLLMSPFSTVTTLSVENEVHYVIKNNIIQGEQFIDSFIVLNKYIC